MGGIGTHPAYNVDFAETKRLDRENERNGPISFSEHAGCGFPKLSLRVFIISRVLHFHISDIQREKRRNIFVSDEGKKMIICYKDF